MIQNTIYNSCIVILKYTTTQKVGTKYQYGNITFHSLLRCISDTGCRISMLLSKNAGDLNEFLCQFDLPESQTSSNFMSPRGSAYQMN